MNQVEEMYVEPFSNIGNLTSLNMTVTGATNETDAGILNNLNSTSKSNHTIIGTMLQTAKTLQNMTNGTTVDTTQFNNNYYIYIWTIGIIACIILTTER